ncbi:LPS assembly lipoprotein LptE [uncultured Roseovarius sp.]|uniref:LPS assembly lipoprotein LptE n=1 Tax=uncultured Roseovarius sp. TaxID=293344 RepID=UPI00261D342F|nr:LPS assembly lipoprotein LptE [uncultured Roseovarius sp.]
MNRTFLRLAALLVTLVVAACGFTPVYAPGSDTAQVLSQIEIAEPRNQNSYLFVRAMEERLGRPTDADKILKHKVSVVGEGVESDTDRRRVVGAVSYQLTDKKTKKLLASGNVDTFAGYSVSDGLFAGAQQDAIERLIIIMADQLTRELMIKLAKP